MATFITDAEVKNMLTLRRRGMTIAQISRLTGRAESTVQYKLKVAEGRHTPRKPAAPAVQPDTRKCQRCIYWASISAAGFAGADKFCSYILVTGHMRGCDPGEKCTKFKPGHYRRQKVVPPPAPCGKETSV